MVTSSTTKDLSFRRRDVDTQENLWSSILGEVQTQGNTKLPGCKNILVLGDNESGKTTLVAKLQGVEEPRKGSGLEYAYIDVRDEYRDDQTRLSVWVLDGDPDHSNLLRFALSEETYSHTLVILTISMTTPWGWMDQLQHWTTVLGEHIDKLSLTTDQRQSARAQVVRGWQNYCERGDELEPGSPIKRNPKKSDMSRSSTDDLQESVEPLVEGALSTNLGVEIVVVVTKTDYMMTLEKELDYRDEHWDFMQQWVRHFCLQHGAALFYTSAKEDKNCDLLYKYLMHRIYGLPFRTPALVVEKDAVLIPAGWDNSKKISILLENLHTCKPDDYYRDVIVPPATRKTAGGREQEVIAEDEQAFLSRQLALLHSGTPPGAVQAPLRSTESPLRNLANMPIPRITPNANQSPKKIDSAKGTPGGERVLANFFNSLLHKNTGSPSVAGSIKVTTNGTSLDTSGSPEQKAAAMRSDAAAELDRLTRLKQEPNSDLDSSEC